MYNIATLAWYTKHRAVPMVPMVWYKNVPWDQRDSMYKVLALTNYSDPIQSLLRVKSSAAPCVVFFVSSL